jgi:hypothetical protein
LGELLQADNKPETGATPDCSLTKKARKITAAQYRAKRILSVYAEPDGLCAMMSFLTER